MERLSPDTIIGIDLGTTNSCGAVAYGDGQVKLIPYKGGDYTIPSIFAIDDKGNELIGHEAKRQWQLNPRNTLYATKRLIGRAAAGRRRRRDAAGRSQYQRARRRAERRRGRLPRPELHASRRSARGSSAKIRDVASDHLGFKVAARGGDGARLLHRPAAPGGEGGRARSIDLEVVRIINEPTAAALAYGIGKRLDETRPRLRPRRRHVRRLDHRDPRPRLRGEGHRRRHLPRRHRLRQRDHPPRPRRLPRQARASTSRPTRWRCSASRTSPSARRSTSPRATRRPSHIPFITMTPQGQPLNIEMKFDRKLLEAAHAAPRGPHAQDRGAGAWSTRASPRRTSTRCMLVGGQTRMPVVQERLTKFFGKPPSKGVHPDEAVAIGAALYALSLAGRLRPEAAAARRDPDGDRARAGGRRDARRLPAQRRHPERASTIAATNAVDDQTRARDAHLPGRPRQVGAERAARRVHLLRRPPGPRRRRCRLEITLRRERRGHPHHVARATSTPGREMKTTVRVATH